jgi:AP-4 complex subunit mu-1
VSASPPALAADGVHFLRLAAGGLHLVAATRDNVSPALTLDLLARVGAIVRDACGALTESAVRRNAVLVYELLDEAVDGGLPQPTDAVTLRERVLSAPVVPRARGRASAPAGGAPGAPPPVLKSVLADASPGAAGGRRDEIFVDVVERLSAVVGPRGRAVRAAVSGSISVKSFLRGAPPVSIALADGITIGRDGGGGAGGDGGGHGGGFDARGAPPAFVRLDDALFHDAVSLARFDSERCLDLTPGDGETELCLYRATRGLALPWGLAASLDDGAAPGRASLTLVLTADFAADRTATGLTITLPLPAEVARAGAEATAARRPARGAGRGALAPPPDRGPPPPAGVADYDEGARLLTWRVPSVAGGAELTLRARLTLAPGVASLSAAARRGVGPATAAFSLPQVASTGLRVRHCHVGAPGAGGGLAGGGAGGRAGAGSPHRWVRYVTTSTAYVFRLA